MEGTVYRTKAEVLKRAEEAIGIPLGEIDKTGRLQTGKGAIGTVIEESWYGYRPNAESEPDFPEAGVELKVTPYVRGKRGIRAKERLVCSIINYMEEYDRTFENSAFWHKCQTLLLMSYEHRYDRPKRDYKIDKAVLFSFPEEDLAIIRQDWERIMAKVRRGEAHRISEGDTLYLAACTKGAGRKTVRPQPFSPIPAKQRAYSLKASYMTHILRAYIFGAQKDERIVKDHRLLEKQSLEEYICQKAAPYMGMTQRELKERFGIRSSPKNLNAMLLGRMLEVEGRIAATEEFKKAGIVPKTVRVRRDGKIQESMSFPTFSFCELIRETWEESTLRELLAPTRFLFVIFREDDRGELVFQRLQFWNIPEDDLEEVHRVWQRTVDTIKRGVMLCEVDGEVRNDLPKASESRVAHVRPHGRNGEDKLPLPDGRMMTKQCFWLNSSYISEQIRQGEETSCEASEVL